MALTHFWMSFEIGFEFWVRSCGLCKFSGFESKSCFGVQNSGYYFKLRGDLGWIFWGSKLHLAFLGVMISFLWLTRDSGQGDLEFIFLWFHYVWNIEYIRFAYMVRVYGDLERIFKVHSKNFCWLMFLVMQASRLRNVFTKSLWFSKVRLAETRLDVLAGFA